MASRGTTFAKLDREREKKAKAQAKQEKRQARSEASTDATDDSPSSAPNEEQIIAALGELHAAYEAGTVSLADFEERRQQLTEALQIP
jgi:hypothetical protein